MKIEVVEGTENDIEIARSLWLKLVQEMYKLEKYIIPTQENADRWADFVRNILYAYN